MTEGQDDEQAMEHSSDGVFFTAVVFELALGVLGIFLGWAIGPDARQAIPSLIESAWPVVKGILYGSLAAIPLLIFIEIVRRIPCEAVRKLESLSEDGLFKALSRLTALELILISICAGVGEELLFRGWMLNWMAQAGGEPTIHHVIAAVIGSSIIFGLVHPMTKLYIVIATIMGIYFAVLLVWTENLLIPIAAHAAYDAVQMLIAKARPETVIIEAS